MIIFKHEKQYFAVNAAIVEEIIDAVVATPLPFADQAIEGLINVHSKVVILFDFSKVIKIERKKESTDSFLVFTDQKKVCALRVGEIVRKVSIADIEVKKKSKIPHYVGQFKFENKMIIVVDLAPLIQKTLHSNDVLPNYKVVLGGPNRIESDESVSRLFAYDQVRYLIAKLNDAFFGVEIKHVQELIFLSEITPVPFLSDYVLGVMNLRQTPVIVLSLSKIVHRQEQSKQYPYGFVVHTGNGIVVFAIHDLKKIESFEKKDCNLFTESKQEIKGWLKITEKKFFPIIDIDYILNGPIFEELEEYITIKKEDDMNNTHHHSRRFLITKLGDELCGIPLDEIKIVVDTISIQELPASPKNMTSNNDGVIKGVAHVHGEIIYVLDTYTMLGKESEVFKNYVIIKTENRNFALSINTIEMVLSIENEKIEKLDTHNDLINQIAKVDKKMISILDMSSVVKLLPSLGGYQ